MEYEEKAEMRGRKGYRKPMKTLKSSTRKVNLAAKSYSGPAQSMQ